MPGSQFKPMTVNVPSTPISHYIHNVWKAFLLIIMSSLPAQIPSGWIAIVLIMNIIKPLWPNKVIHQIFKGYKEWIAVALELSLYAAVCYVSTTTPSHFSWSAMLIVEYMTFASFKMMSFAWGIKVLVRIKYFCQNAQCFWFTVSTAQINNSWLSIQQM